MKIRLESSVRYPESKKWQIHNNYFQQRGARAWENGEIPFDITSNARAAFQNAQVVFEALQAQRLPPDSRINILEVASGYGLFAIHFLDAFKSICTRFEKDYYSRVRYLVTDYSKKTVSDLANNSILSELMEKGVVDFLVYDALAPSYATKLDGSMVCLKEGMLSAVIANYVHCTLPLTILRKENGDWFEKHIALYLDIGESAQVEDEMEYAREIVRNPAKQEVLSRLSEEIDYHKIEIEQFLADVHMRAAVVNSGLPFDTATIVVPLGSMQHIKSILPFLRKNAVLLISDKGYGDATDMEGKLACAPSIHTNCFAHSTNFPVLDAFVQNISGLSSIYTNNPGYSLKTLLVARNDDIPPNIGAKFRELFIEDNFNIDSTDFYYAAYDYETDGKWDKAIVFYLKTLKYRINDAKINYRLAQCYLNQGRFTEALACCIRGKQYDYMEKYDFFFLEGRLHYRLEQYVEAIESYEQSMERFGEFKECCYNIGLCFTELKDRFYACCYYKKALELDPDYQKARDAVNGW